MDKYIAQYCQLNNGSGIGCLTFDNEWPRAW